MSQSNSNFPDLDWSQVRETVKLLTVSVAQVESNMKTGDTSVNTLTESFVSLVEHMNSISDSINLLESSNENEKEEILSQCVEASNKVQSSVIAFQFYDRLQQSLSHVSKSLKGLSILIESPERLYNPQEWKKFQDGIRARYTMESEKEMFDAILAGKSIEDAIQLATAVDANNEEEEIDLF